MERRTFIAGLIATPVVLSACGGGGGSQGAPAPVSANEPIGRARHFRGREGDLFYVEHPLYGSVDAELVSLVDNTMDPSLEQFLLTFALPAGSNLGDGMRRLTHRTLGEMALFLQGGRDDGVHQFYSAAFSHLLVANTPPAE